MKRLHFGCLALACLFVGANLEQATAAIVNGGFETGDLSGWTLAGTGPASVITNSNKLEENGTWTPKEGSYFAILISEEQDVYTTLSQSFTASAGETLSLYAFFDTGDYLPFNDDGYVSLIDVETSSTTTLYARSVSHPDVGNYGSDGWQHLTHTFANSGSYQIQAGVRNVGDSGWTSWIGLDGVSLSNPAVPEPATLTIWGVFGALGLVAARRRKRVA